MADKNKISNAKISAEEKDAKKLNSLFKDTLNNITQNIFKSGNEREDEILQISKTIEDIIEDELNNTKSITTDEMSTFLVKLFNEMDTQGTILPGTPQSLDDIFGDNSTGMFEFFQQRYQNQNLLYEDLEMITSQLPEMEEAVMTTRDAIITADDFSESVSKNITFNDFNNGDEGINSAYQALIKKVENDLKLPTKIKNLIIPYTLIFGSYYAYICPYSELFKNQYNKKVKDPYSRGVYEATSIVMESKSASDNELISKLKENITKFESSLPEEEKNKSKGKKKDGFSIDDKKLLNTVNEYLNDIKINNEPVPIPILEGFSNDGLNPEDFIKKRDEVIKQSEKNTINKTADGTIDVDPAKNKFKDIKGCFIKYIEPKRMIPVKILDHVIGYYYIHDVDFQVNKAPFSTTIRVTNTGGINNDVENMFLTTITDRIVKAFDKKFLEDNIEFKELIANALQYNDLYKKQITFQFIPAEYVQEFKVNEDVDGNGRSILMKSLFYAKLYLSLLVFKMISIITRSNDQRVYYVKNSGIDQNITNKVQDVARSIKGRQINFMDLLNYNSIISKIGSYKEIFIPVGRSGERGVEFDILSGQDIQLNTELMELLRTNMVNATGVPSVILNYVNEAD